MDTDPGLCRAATELVDRCVCTGMRVCMYVRTYVSMVSTSFAKSGITRVSRLKTSVLCQVLRRR